MYFLGRLLGGAAKEKIEESIAKRKLEKKLGRKVQDHELYSLNAHIEASADDTPQVGDDINRPGTDIPRATEHSFGAGDSMANAGRKRGRLKKFVLISLAVISLVTLVGVGTYFYSTRAPAGTFPANAGKFTLKRRQSLLRDSEFPNARRLMSEYGAPDVYSVSYAVYEFPSAADASTALDKEKKKFEEYKRKNVREIAVADDRVFSVSRSVQDSTLVYWIDGPLMIYLYGSAQDPVLELEAALRRRAPEQALIVEPLPESIPKKDYESALAFALLNEFRKDELAADKKYTGKTLEVSGVISTVLQDKKGAWTVGMMAPGAKSATEGIILCTFKDSSYQKLKTEQLGTVRGRFSISLAGNVFLEECTVP